MLLLLLIAIVYLPNKLSERGVVFLLIGLCRAYTACRIKV